MAGHGLSGPRVKMHMTPRRKVTNSSTRAIQRNKVDLSSNLCFSAAVSNNVT